ncbi:hypothetical protein NDU88_004470 [Pleurodeles waltl]|uniref:Pentatricopeptide repeat-containing protein 2, mitochondrial n=1 Tax=Pleurodeles waltl TaxID=8319 RepID=A0AAV7W7Y9_PLEWA|nr:hypothetical protein NDU88_004470 [Pleurodeles waltl]
MAAGLWACGSRRSLLGCRRVTTEVKQSCWRRPHGANRYLLTDDVLRLQEFQEKKVAIAYQIYGNKDLYFKRIEDKLKENELVHKEELKKFLHLCQTAADVELAKTVIYRYHSENINGRFGEFKFGPLFIRLCYELDLPETALELIKDKTLIGFFCDCTSFNILMDMLFTKGHYESALEVLLEMRRQKIKFSRETYILGFAICYKLNRSESPSICCLLLDEIDMKAEHIPRQAFCFAAALALKQNDIAKAKSIFSRIMNTDSRICNNLNILIQAESGAMEDVLHVLEVAEETGTPHFVKKPEISEEVLAAVREKVKNNPTQCARFEKVYSKLQTSGQTSLLSLDDMLCQTPHQRKHHPIPLEQRKINPRTFRSLQSTLLAE